MIRRKTNMNVGLLIARWTVGLGNLSTGNSPSLRPGARQLHALREAQEHSRETTGRSPAQRAHRLSPWTLQKRPASSSSPQPTHRRSSHAPAGWDQATCPSSPHTHPGWDQATHSRRLGWAHLLPQAGIRLIRHLPLFADTDGSILRKVSQWLGGFRVCEWIEKRKK